MSAGSPSELENAREPWITRQVGGLPRLLPHPRLALNDEFSISAAAVLPRQVKQGKRQRSDAAQRSANPKAYVVTRKQFVNPKRYVEPGDTAAASYPPSVWSRLAQEAWTPPAACPAPVRRSGRGDGRQESGGKWDLPAGKSEESRIARRRTSETEKAATPSKVKSRMTSARPRRWAAPAPRGPLSPRPRPPRDLPAAL